MKYVFFFLFLLFPTLGYCALDEVVLSNEKGDCALHYLTTKQKKNWTMKVQEGQCENGWIHGYAEIKILTPNKNLSETLSGFFMDGYWLGNFMGKGHILTRTNPEENQQGLSYLLENKEDIQYVVQLRSLSQEGRAYGPFSGCPDFRILAVSENMDQLDESQINQRIKPEALNQAHLLCSELDTVALFGSNKVSPEPQQILFQLQITPDTMEEKWIKLPSIQGEKENLNKRKKNQPQEIEKKEKLLPLAHLDLLSRIQNKPQKGRTLVHISQLNLDGSAKVDLPQPVLLKNNPNLRLGWVIVEGDYFNSQMSVSKVQLCQKEWCADVS